MSHLWLNRDILTHKGIEHIRADLKALPGVVHIVSEIAGTGVPECVLEIRADKIQNVGPFIDESTVRRGIFPFHRHGEQDGLEP